jgi:hypothetical protein
MTAIGLAEHLTGVYGRYARHTGEFEAWASFSVPYSDFDGNRGIVLFPVVPEAMTVPLILCGWYEFTASFDTYVSIDETRFSTVEDITVGSNEDPVWIYDDDPAAVFSVWGGVIWSESGADYTAATFRIGAFRPGSEYIDIFFESLESAEGWPVRRQVAGGTWEEGINKWRVNVFSMASGCPDAQLSDDWAYAFEDSIRVSWTSQTEFDVSTYELRDEADWSLPLGEPLATVLPTGAGSTYTHALPLLAGLDSIGIYARDLEGELELLGLPVVADVAQEQWTVDSSTYPTYTRPSGSPPGGSDPAEYLIVVPAGVEWEDVGQDYADFWSWEGGTESEVYGMPAGTTAALLKSEIATRAANGIHYILLVGDSSDAAWYDDPLTWTGTPGFENAKPGFPSQPQFDLIPSWAVFDSSPRDQNIPHVTPYYTTDSPYGDTDDDGIVDLIVGRLPVQTPEEFGAYFAKLREFVWEWMAPTAATAAVVQRNTPSNGRTLEAHVIRGVNTISDQWASSMQGSVLNLPIAEDLLQYFDGSVGTVFSVATGHNWYSLHEKLHVSGVQQADYPTSDLLPFVASLSCLGAAYDLGEDPTNGRPLCERLLIMPDRGAIGLYGPTRGTRTSAAYEFAGEVIQALGRGTATSYAHAVTIARNKLVVSPDPSAPIVADSFIYLGDPRLALKSIASVTSVERPERGTVPGIRVEMLGGRGMRFVLSGIPENEGQVSIYDVRGRSVARIALESAGEELAGIWTGVDRRGAPSASGVYYYRASAGTHLFKGKVAWMERM